MPINKAVQFMNNTVPFIRLSTTQPIKRREEWRQWKPLGYRVLDKDGVTVYHELEGIRRIVLAFFQDIDADVFLFGSQVAEHVGRYSDYDIGYDTEEKISSSAFADLEESLEELPIPGKVDLVDFKKVSDEFAKIALKGGFTVWKQKQRNSRFILNV
jgi:predicted nucleotidyltransferase